MEPIGQRRSRRFVQDAFDLQSGDAAGVQRGLALLIVEIGRHGDDCSLDRMAKMSFGVFFERAQYQAAQFFGRIGAAAELDLPVGPHVALEERSAVLGVQYLQLFGRGADEQLFLFVDAYDRRGQRAAQSVENNPWSVVGQISHQRIGSAQVDSDDFRHGCDLSSLLCALSDSPNDAIRRVELPESAGFECRFCFCTSSIMMRLEPEKFAGIV